MSCSSVLTRREKVILVRVTERLENSRVREIKTIADVSSIGVILLKHRKKKLDGEQAVMHVSVLSDKSNCKLLSKVL